ncbi:MAG: GPO family capsid scaffolding protein [Pseudomonadota bacterium]
MAKTKFFRVAVEGDTVDGRKIERSWLTDIAQTYNRQTYGARVNMEHIRGITASAPFKAYGDVLSVKTDEVDIELGGKTQKKLALLAELDVTDDLVAINRDKQKLYTSIEVQPNFANTGKAYLVGLAVTDSPASLGTDVLQFALKHGAGMSLAPRPQQDGNVFSLGLETTFELDAAAPPATPEYTGLFAAATAFFKSFTEGKPPVEPVKEEPVVPANDNDMGARFAAFGKGIEQLTAGIEKMGADFTGQVAALKGEIAAVKTSIETTDAHPTDRRPLAPGGGNYAVTDC